MKKLEFEHIERQEYSEEMNEILELCNKNHRDTTQELWLNHLKVCASSDLLDSFGQVCEVKSGKKDRRTHKLGLCYYNSVNMTEKGYKYVEGIVHPKDGSSPISHAWNVDKNGSHYDFTFDNPEDYIYTGVLLSERNLYQVGFNNGGIWFCALPFLKVEE